MESYFKVKPKVNFVASNSDLPRTADNVFQQLNMKQHSVHKFSLLYINWCVRRNLMTGVTT